MAVYGWFDLKDKIKKYFRFSKEELKGLTAAVLVMAFIISFKDWGQDTFSFFTGLGNLIVSIIIVGFSVLLHVAAQKIYALHMGFKAEFKLWWYGLLIGLILIFFTRGNFWFLAAGGIFIHHLTTHRLGFFRYGTNIQAFGSIALVGPIANILFATFVKFFQVNLHLFSPENPILNKIFLFNFAFAAYSLLPIPPLDGSRLFFKSRMTYAFIAGIVISYIVLIVLLEIYSFVWAFILGVVIWLSYYILFEREAWKPV